MVIGDFVVAKTKHITKTRPSGFPTNMLIIGQRQVPTYPSGQIGAFMARKGGGTGTLAVEGGTPRCHGGAKWLRFGD